MKSEQDTKLTETGLFPLLSEREKVLFILYDYPGCTKEEIAECCYSVSIVSYVSTNKNNKSNNLNKNNKNNTLEKEEKENQEKIRKDKIILIINRLHMTLLREIKNHRTVKVNKSSRPFRYSLTEEGKKAVQERWMEYHIEQKKEMYAKEYENIIQKQIDFFHRYFSQEVLIAELYNAFNRGQAFFVVDMMDLARFDPWLANQVLDGDSEEVIKSAETAISLFDLPKDMPEFRVYFSNLPSDCIRPITNLRAKDIGKLRVVVAEIRSRSQSAVQVHTTRYSCPECGNAMTVLHIDREMREPNKCTCGRKGKMIVMSNSLIDILRLNVSDLYEHLGHNEVPEEIGVILRNDHFGFSRLNEGDKVEIVAVPHIVSMSDKSKTTEQKKVLYCYGFSKLEQDYSTVAVVEADVQRFKDILQDPFAWHRAALFRDLRDVQLAETVSIMGLYGTLHLLFCGTYGSGKSVTQKRCSYAALRGTYIDCMKATASGVLGTVSKNEFTGKYSVDGGVFRPMHPGGIVVLDELNEDGDYCIQKAINGIMNDRTLTMHKANVRLNVPCEVSVWASVNLKHKNSYDDCKEASDNFGVLGKVWDRFDLVVYFHNRMPKDTPTIAKMMEEHRESFEMPDDQLELMKKYQLRARAIKVKFGQHDFEKLALLMNEYFEKVDCDGSNRRIGTIKRIMESICRLHHRDRPIDLDYVLLTDLFSQLSMAKSAFKVEVGSED